MPEWTMQIAFLCMNGCDHFFLFALATSMSSFFVALSMNLRLNRSSLNRLFSVHRTAFLVEISSLEINRKCSSLLLRPSALKAVFAEILGVDGDCIELPLFEAIKVNTRCHGLKLYLSVNTHTISRRAVLMKLEDAQKNEELVKGLVTAWNLEQDPSIDDIAMVYDLGGDLVIQRFISFALILILCSFDFLCFSTKSGRHGTWTGNESGSAPSDEHLFGGDP